MSDELLRAKPEKYQVNRGIGKPVEFKGLKSQYLFIFCGGLLAVFVVFIVLFMAGVNQWLCIGFIVSASLLLVWQTFRLNARYGTHGLIVTVQASDVKIPAGASDYTVKEILRKAIEPVTGDAVFVERWKTVTDAQGNLAWQVWAHR